MKENFAKRLNYLREEKGLSQEKLAKALNYQVSQSAIAAWEISSRVPTLDSAIILADFFDVSLDYIAGRED